MNIVTLIGRLTRDPELRFTPGTGTGVTTVTLAVDNYNSKTGEKSADFIPVVIYGTRAENVAQYLLKGSQIAVSGRIATRNYDAKDGTKRYVTEVVADNVTFLGSRASGSQISESSSNTSSYTANSAVSNNTGMVNNDIVTPDLDMDPYAAMGNEVSLSDDDLPF